MNTTTHCINLWTTDVGLGLPLVFIHGFPLNSGVWQKQVDALRTSYRVITPDLRGFGKSESSPELTTMEQYAEDVHGLLQRLTAQPVVLVGHSMGGYVALAYARLFPEMLSGLVLVSTQAGQDTAEQASGRRATAEKVKTEGVQCVVDAMAPKMLAAKNQDQPMAQQVREIMGKAIRDGVISALLGIAARPDSAPSLGQIFAPTLVITGADDTVISLTESEKLAQAIHVATLKVIQHAGHLVAFEQPEEFNRVLVEWLTQNKLISPEVKLDTGKNP